MKKSRSPRGGLNLVYERRNGTIVGFRVRGHAGFAVAGRDVVCAAASALVLSAANGLRRHCGVNPAISDTPAQFRLSLAGGSNARAQAVLATMVSGLEAIGASYPGYLSIRQGGIAATGPRSRPAKSKSSRAR